MDVFQTLRDLNTLLIDDDEWIRDAFVMLFESEACCLTVLETAEEALAELKKNTYDLIIVDYKLPGLNGLELLRRLPETSAGTITMLITAYLTDSVVSEASDLHVQGVLEKPFSSETFFDSLSAVLKNRCRQPSGA
jgi:DNA-binding NtrC family response regulator